MVKPTQRDGNMVTKTQTIANQRFITSYSYDEHDRMTSKTYPSGKVVGYVYDDKGELVSLNIDGVPFISDIKTNDNGLLSYTYADDTKHTRTYDENGRVKELNYPNYTEKVNYNKVSNITNIQSDAMSRAFGYDNLDRLTSYEQNATDFQNFAYDANGNRLSQSQEENSSKTFDYLANSNILNTIQDSNGTDTKEISYEYDATGNIIKDDKHTYSYDGRNRLTAIDNNVTYQYNYDNKRVSKTVNGVKTYFIYDGYKLIGEYELNINDESRQEIVYLNSTPIATVTPKGTYRIYSDHLDTSRRVATNDEEAEVLWEWESKPFGESLANEDVDQDGKAFRLNLRFPGQYFDRETKTHYNINRDYNPVTGRYIQSDPIGFDGGSNTFGYVKNLPIRWIDAEGKEVTGIFNINEGTLYVADNDTAKYVIVDAFTGGQIGRNGTISITDDGANQKPAPKGTYIITKNPHISSGHEDWFGLVRKDDRLDDYFTDNGTERNGIRLHNGSESWGCITIKNNPKQWNDLRKILLNTNATTFPFIEGPHWWNPTVSYPKYGTVEIQ